MEAEEEVDKWNKEWYKNDKCDLTKSRKLNLMEIYTSDTWEIKWRKSRKLC